MKIDLSITLAASKAAYRAEVLRFARDLQAATAGIEDLELSEQDARLILALTAHPNALEEEQEHPENCGWKSWSEATLEQRAYWSLNYDAAELLREKAKTS